MSSNLIGKLLRPFVRLRRIMSGSRPFNVVVEGNIGSGKTTFLEHFRQYEADVCILPEPVARWMDFNGHNLLALMYADAEKWSFSFESYVLLTMMQQHQYETTCAIRLIERSLFSAYHIFVAKMCRDGAMPPPSAAVLAEWFRFLSEHQSHSLAVDLIVYLRTTPEVVHQRARLRNRDGEKCISLAYLTDLHRMHEEWLIRKTIGTCPAPVLVINADLDKTAIVDEYRRHEEDILRRRIQLNTITS